MSYAQNPNAIHQHPPHSPMNVDDAKADSAQPGRPVQPAHKRTYQACIPCRQRKVRCDLGSVEAPHDPPCVRCRRESKECFFSATRRKRTPSAEILPGLGRGRGVRKIEDGVENSDATKRTRTSTLPHIEDPPPQFQSPDYSPTICQTYAPAIDPQLSRQQPLHSLPVHLLPVPPLQSRHDVTSTDTLLQTQMYNSHEALLTLIEAAGKDTPMESSGMKSESHSPSTTAADEGVGNASSIVNSPAQALPGRWNPQQQSVHFAESETTNSSSYSSSHPQSRKSGSHVSPKTGGTPRSQPSDEGIEKALRAWNKFRFVKAGWFTAREAMGFVEYFYKNLHPLSPTLTNPTLQHVSHPRNHHLLLRHEPFLATSILTVASRYLTLAGPGGQSRSFAIHDMLWREVRSAFERLMWGGGWGGLGVPRASGVTLPVDPQNGGKTGRGLRTVGTVEGLLILTEWHVRGLQFPMDVEEIDWGIDVTDDESSLPPTPAPGAVIEGLGDRIENILEPAYRSDRMSWMLLGNALALAYELGVFDDSDVSAPKPEAETSPFKVRSKRIQKLLLVYVLQLASRLGWTSMIPRGVRDSVQHPLKQPSLPINWHNNPDLLQDAIYTSWVELTMLMNKSSEVLFPSRAGTREIMRSGQYMALLNHFRPLLQQWLEGFMQLNLPQPIYSILILEYEHVRFYVNSLALQAVIDRCWQLGGSTAVAPSSTPAQTPAGFVPMLSLSPVDAGYIREVVQACRSLLTTVVEDMYPHGYLKHAPVRIYLRILSASMFLLKTFALGAKEVEVERSMELIDSVCDALRGAAVDDVHLGLRFADLLRGLAGRVRGRLGRVPTNQGPVALQMINTPGGAVEDGATGEGYVWDISHAPQAGEDMEGQTGGSGYDWNHWGNEDWLALPLDPILGFEGVTQGTMGVDVGGVDLLEVLLAPPTNV